MTWIYASQCNSAPSITEEPGVAQKSAYDWSEVRKSIEGRGVVIRFFATWSGVNNPVKPKQAVDLIAAQELRVYYECSYQKIGRRDLLVRFEKYGLNKRVLSGLEIPATVGDAPFLAIGDWLGPTPRDLHPITPEEVIAASEYIFHRKGMKVGEATYVRRVLLSSREYRYSDSGDYLKFVDHL